jgi:hypothetical protein
LFVSSVGPRFKTNTIALRLGERLDNELPPLNGPIPVPLVRETIGQVKSLLPGVKTAKGVAAVVFNVWEKMHVRPPAVVATVALLLVYLFGALLAIGVIQLGIGANSVERQIERAVDDINKRLPMQVDEVTRLDRVEPGPGKAYTYVCTVSKDLTEQQKRVVIDNATRKLLAAPEMQAAFAAGVTIRYEYHDSAGRKVLEFSVTK